MIKIEEPNQSYKSCYDCTHYDDSVEMCILRKCIHAVGQLKECYVSKQQERKKGKWLDGHRAGYDEALYWYIYCSECLYERDDDDHDKDTPFCPNCGVEME